MGTYDTFIFKRKCPECKERLEEWQTKQLAKVMRYWEVGDEVKDAPDNCKVECHNYCDTCCKRFVAWAVIKDGKYRNLIVPPKGQIPKGVVLNG